MVKTMSATVVRSKYLQWLRVAHNAFLQGHGWGRVTANCRNEPRHDVRSVAGRLQRFAIAQAKVIERKKADAKRTLTC